MPSRCRFSWAIRAGESTSPSLRPKATREQALVRGDTYPRAGPARRARQLPPGPAPLFHATNPAERQKLAYARELKEVAYRFAAEQLGRGILDIVFPTIVFSRRTSERNESLRSQARSPARSCPHTISDTEPSDVCSDPPSNFRRPFSAITRRAFAVTRFSIPGRPRNARYV